MRSRPPYQLRYPLAMWNLFLSLFSCYGFLRTGPHLFHRIYQATSIQQALCESIYVSYGGGCVGLVSLLFVFSKILELGDTIFLILKKKPLLFLHLYHHITVLLFCWNSALTLSSMAIYFIVMNTFIHSFMYFYFFLQSIDYLPVWFPGWIITSMQIMQMFLGCLIVGMVYHLKSRGKEECFTEFENISFGLILYASYLLCFVHFALKRNCPVLFDRLVVLGEKGKGLLGLFFQELDQMFLRAYGWPFEHEEEDDHVVVDVDRTAATADHHGGHLMSLPQGSLLSLHREDSSVMAAVAEEDRSAVLFHNPGTPRPPTVSVSLQQDDHLLPVTSSSSAATAGVVTRRGRKKKATQTYP